MEFNKSKKTVVGVTGATGTLGSALVQLFLSRNFAVVCLVRNRKKVKLPETTDLTFIEGDISNKQAVEQFVVGLDACIHLAAHVGHGTIEAYRNVNVIGTQNICDAIVSKNPKCRFVNCSSIAAMRVPKYLTFLATVYARSKHEADEVVKKYQFFHGLMATTVYPGLIYGPGDTKFLPTVIQSLKKEKIFYVSGGEYNAPLIYIDDICELFFLATTRKEALYKHYIGTAGDKIGIHDFFNLIAERVNAKKPSRKINKHLIMPCAILLENIYRLECIQKSPPLSRRVVDILSISFTQQSINENQKIGWRAKVSPREGIDRYLRWANS